MRNNANLMDDSSCNNLDSDGDGGSILYNSSDGCYWLPEIVVTPTGNHVDNNYTDYGHDNYTDYDNDPNNDYYNTGGHSDHDVGGGGNSSDGSGGTSNYLQEGQADLNFFQHEVDNHQAIYLQQVHSDTVNKGLAIASDVSLLQTYADAAINYLKASTSLTEQLGKYLGPAGLIVNHVSLVVAFTDGKISPSDICSAASTALGDVGYAASMTGVFTPEGLACEGLSVCFGVASMLVPGDDGSAGGRGY